MKAKVTVKLKKGVLDPQGNAVLHASQSLGLKEVEGIRVGKVFEIEWKGEDKAAAEEKLKSLANKLLANPVIEDFAVEILAS